MMGYKYEQKLFAGQLKGAAAALMSALTDTEFRVKVTIKMLHG